MSASVSATSAIGNRGRELASVVAGLKSSAQRRNDRRLRSVERKSRARGQGAADEYGRAPLSFQYVEDMLAAKDVDAVIISTADFQHAPLLRMAAEAGKDAYCEKPMATDLEEAKAARDAVLSRKLIVQIGTQHRSEPYQAAVRELVANGRARPHQQGRDRLELSRTALARPARSEADPRAGHRLAQMAARPSPTGRSIRAPISNSGCIATSPAAFPING